MSGTRGVRLLAMSQRRLSTLVGLWIGLLVDARHSRLGCSVTVYDQDRSALLIQPKAQNDRGADHHRLNTQNDWQQQKLDQTAH